MSVSHLHSVLLRLLETLPEPTCSFFQLAREPCAHCECQMSFPTADEVAYFSLFLRLTGIQKLVTEARPELTELTAVAGPQLALTIDLPASPSGYHNRVVLASRVAATCRTG